MLHYITVPDSVFYFSSMVMLLSMVSTAVSSPSVELIMR